MNKEYIYVLKGFINEINACSDLSELEKVAIVKVATGILGKTVLGIGRKLSSASLARYNLGKRVGFAEKSISKGMAKDKQVAAGFEAGKSKIRKFRGRIVTGVGQKHELHSKI